MKCRLANKRSRAWRSRYETCAGSVAFSVFALCTVAVLSQEPLGNTSSTKTDARNDTARGSFVIAPIPMASPAVGNGAVVLGGYIFRHDLPPRSIPNYETMVRVATIPAEGPPKADPRSYD